MSRESLKEDSDQVDKHDMANSEKNGQKKSEDTGTEERPKMIRGMHFGTYIQSGENLELSRIGDEDRWKITVIDWDEERINVTLRWEPIILSPTTDLSGLDLHTLEEIDQQMYYAGELDDNHARFAKFSETRKNIQRAIQDSEKD